MRILAFDTALGACSAAIWADGVLAARAFELRGRGHAETLLPMIQSVCADAGLDMQAMNRLAVTVGPGSFAGTRVGLATARGLALATGLPVVGVTTLEAIVFGLEPKPGGVVVASFDAYRDELYAQVFGPGLEPVTRPAALAVAEAADLVQGGPVLLAGNGADRLASEFNFRAIPYAIATDRDEPDAAIFAALAAVRELGHSAPGPLYLRPPDARMPERAR